MHLFFQGFYCDSRLANASLLRPCPKGHYCPTGTSLPNQYPCPTGTFNPRQATHSPSECMQCAAGQHCPSVGLADPAGEKSILRKKLYYIFFLIFCKSTSIALYLDSSASVLQYYNVLQLQSLIRMGCLPYRTVPCRLLVQAWGFLSHSSGWIIRLAVSSWSLLPPRFQWSQ